MRSYEKLTWSKEEYINKLNFETDKNILLNVQ